MNAHHTSDNRSLLEDDAYSIGESINIFYSSIPKLACSFEHSECLAFNLLVSKALSTLQTV